MYGAEKAHAKWWKEVEEEEKKRAKKGQKLNRFDGLYHSDNEDEDAESKKEFADGGVVSGANFYVDRKPNHKKANKHHKSSNKEADY